MQQEKMGCLLRSLRKEKGMTQEQIAEIFGVTNRTVSRWENGKNMPDVSILVEISKFFGVSILELIEGERKQDKMMTDNKEELQTLANYADEQKGIILKNVHRTDLINFLLCMLVLIAIPKFEETGHIGWLMAEVLPLGAMCGILLSEMSYSVGLHGIVRRYQQKYRILKYLELLILIVCTCLICRDVYLMFVNYANIIL